MKSLFLVLMLVVSLSARWEYVEEVDEMTDETRAYIINGDNEIFTIMIHVANQYSNEKIQKFPFINILQKKEKYLFTRSILDAYFRVDKNPSIPVLSKTDEKYSSLLMTFTDDKILLSMGYELKVNDTVIFNTLATMMNEGTLLRVQLPVYERTNPKKVNPIIKVSLEGFSEALKKLEEHEGLKLTIWDKTK